MFANRVEAGKKLAQKLSHLKGKKVVVLGIARGGVVVAAQVARALKASLDVVVVKKIGAPGQPELAIGAVGPGGIQVVDWELAGRTGVDEAYVEREAKVKGGEVRQRMKVFRGQKKPVSLKGKTVILVDDGVATGATVEAALRFLASQKPQELILAVPVGASDSLEKLAPLTDEVVCLERPPFFAAVGQFYREFDPVSDDEVRETLKLSSPV